MSRDTNGKWENRFKSRGHIEDNEGAQWGSGTQGHVDKCASQMTVKAISETESLVRDNELLLRCCCCCSSGSRQLICLIYLPALCPASLCVLPGTSLGRYLLDPLAEGVPIDASPRVWFAWEKEVPCWVTVLRRRGVLPAGCAKQINRNIIDGQNRNDHHNALSL